MIPLLRRLPELPRVLTLLFLLSAAPLTTAGEYTTHTLQVGDRERQYALYWPDSAPTDRPAAAIIAYHGFMSDPSGMRWLTKADPAADAFGFVIVYPQAIDGSFNAGRGSGTRESNVDEAAFIDALLKHIPNAHNLDKRNLFTMGFSNGAQMSALMWCNYAGRIRGAAIVAHSLNITPCEPKRPVPIVLMQGAKDPYVPFGGGGPYDLRSHKASLAELKRLHAVQGEGDIVVDLKTIRCRNFEDRVRSCVGYADGHTWPGALEFQPEQFGLTNTEVVANEFIMSFFTEIADNQQTTGTGVLGWLKRLFAGLIPKQNADQENAS